MGPRYRSTAIHLLAMGLIASWSSIWPRCVRFSEDHLQISKGWFSGSMIHVISDPLDFLRTSTMIKLLYLTFCTLFLFAYTYPWKIHVRHMYLHEWFIFYGFHVGECTTYGSYGYTNWTSRYSDIVSTNSTKFDLILSRMNQHPCRLSLGISKMSSEC